MKRQATDFGWFSFGKSSFLACDFHGMLTRGKKNMGCFFRDSLAVQKATVFLPELHGNAIGGLLFDKMQCEEGTLIGQRGRQGEACLV